MTEENEGHNMQATMAQRSVLEQSSLDDFIAKAEWLGRNLGLGRSVRSFETAGQSAKLCPIASRNAQNILKHLTAHKNSFELTSAYAHDIT